MNQYRVGLNDPKALAMMAFTMTYCIFGMTLISMCLSLMQEQIIEKVSFISLSQQNCEYVKYKGIAKYDEEIMILSI